MITLKSNFLSVLGIINKNRVVGCILPISKRHMGSGNCCVVLKLRYFERKQKLAQNSGSLKKPMINERRAIFQGKLILVQDNAYGEFKITEFESVGFSCAERVRKLSGNGK